MSAKVEKSLVNAETKNAGRVLKTIVCDARLLLIGLWLGASVFFSFILAPSVFAVLPTRDLAGAVVQRTLMVVNVSGFVVGVILLVSAFLLREGVKKISFIIEIVSLLLLAVTLFIGHWVIAAQMRAYRLQMGRPIDELAQTDALRVAFNSLHEYSVIVLSIGMISAVIAFLLIARRRQF